MAIALIGLCASVGLYLSAIYGIEWSSSRRIKAAESRGIAVDAAPSFPTAAEIVRRHSIEWAIGFAVFFIALEVADFSLWQRLGIAVILAMTFGSMWLAQTEPGEGAPPTNHSMGSNVWYWLLAVGDWMGFLSVLCFATEILVRAA